jgi:acetyl-CoA/propionyl-CoA carboxylase, biotin carboxylase, biotin carboxyl carrier protein
MPSKILVANRGEIAVRVMRTCRELGIATVAVYSELDRDAMHVRYADEAYALGGQTAAESYLNVPAILDAISRSGADAVHPGYGFFSENADFARTIGELPGVAWIGPPPEAIEVMGDKISSRVAMDKAGVAGVPGTLEPLTTADEVAAFGAAHGYPLAIQAAFGGGGRGMKVVASADDVADAMASAQREAQAYFGRPEVYVERYLARGRHVEVQVFADTHGNVVYVGDRDCSIQRRHQKLIEEAPAPGIPDETHRAMGEMACAAARACGYVGAGTVEMLYQDGDFFFLEMNTRLQVEHCVTELVFGVDLVAEQIRVASGEPLSFTQDSLTPRGHAIQCRLNAEDPVRDYMPTPGTLTRFDRPDGFGIRLDAGYGVGDTVSQYYDNLLAKLVVWGIDREDARRRMLRALDEVRIDGVKTTVPAQVAVLRAPAFVAVQHSTKWLEDELDKALIVAEAERRDGAAPPAPAADDAPALTAQTVPVEVGGKRFEVKLWLPEAPAAAAAPAAAKRSRPKVAASAGGSGSGTVSAPMQGTIVKVEVAVGDAVEAGQTVVVLEAMKMENQIAAEKSGTVTEVRVAAGETVGGGDVLVVIA